MKIILLLLVVLSIPVNSTLINIKKNIKNTKIGYKNNEKRLLNQKKGSDELMEIIAAIIIIFLFFNSPVWAIAIFTLPVLYNGIQYMYKFEEQKKGRKLLEISPEFLKKKVLNKELEDYLKKLKSNIYKYLSISTFKIKKQLDERQLVEMVKDYFKNKDKLNENKNKLNENKDKLNENKKNLKNIERVLKEEMNNKNSKTKIDAKVNLVKDIKENISFDLDKNIEMYSKFIFKGRIQFRQLMDEL